MWYVFDVYGSERRKQNQRWGENGFLNSVVLSTKSPTSDLIKSAYLAYWSWSNPNLRNDIDTPDDVNVTSFKLRETYETLPTRWKRELIIG